MAVRYNNIQRPSMSVSIQKSTAPLPYVSGTKKTFIFTVISLFHALLIFIPAIFITLDTPPKNRLLVLVPTVDKIPGEAPSQQPSNQPSKSRQLPQLDNFKKLTDIPELPPEPDPETEPTKETPAPKPEPKSEPKPQPPVKNRKEKPIEKPMEGGKRPVKTNTPIKKSTKKVTRPTTNTKKKAAEAKARKDAENKRRLQEAAKRNRERSIRAAAAQRTRDIQNMLRGMSGGSGASSAGSGRGGVTANDIETYYDKVTTTLYRHWNQPNISNLQNQEPTVILKLKIDKNGRIISATVTQKSGVAAMDNSVDELLEKVKVLPIPPRAMEITVTMEIER